MAAHKEPSVLHSVADLLDRPVATDQLLQTMVDRIKQEVGAERCTLYLIDANTSELVSKVAHLPELKEIRLPMGKGVAGHVAATGHVLNLPDVKGDPRWFSGIDAKTGFETRSMLVVPVLDRDHKTIGVIQLLNKSEGLFDEGDELLLEQLAEQVGQALDCTSMRPADHMEQGLILDGPLNHFIGNCPAMKELFDHILSAAPTDATVLIRGESGTGKTLVAQALHENSARREGPFVHVDCTTLPSGLIESELFGHERGAFTGAERTVLGKVEQAHGGTLFLDEIGDLPLELQGKLLRFLQEQRFERLGGRKTIQVDVRIVAATNADLEALMSSGRLRTDLYYRLRVVQLFVPELKQRGPTDIEKLALHFLSVFSRRYRKRPRTFSDNALRRLVMYDWPGNVRELEHCIESAVVLSRSELIDSEHLSLPASVSESAITVTEGGGYAPGLPLEEVERDHIRRTLDACGGNRTKAARLLGIGRNTLARKLK